MTIRVLTGDCRDVLPTLAAASVQCVVTSPPYYGLRDYGVAGQLGLEATPEEWLAEMVAVFREVRRVLRDDGTLWLNVGDSYATGGHRTTGAASDSHWSIPSAWDSGNRRQPIASTIGNGIKPKDLLMMPARLALALQADGWWLRSDIIWHKPNPMPESVVDRPTSAHEHVFLLSKSARYFYDADAVAELSAYPGDNRALRTDTRKAHDPMCTDGGSRLRTGNPTGETRNIRNVWTIATAPFPEAHFATFPPELAERCIRAGTSERGCCTACGTPWARQTERVDTGRVQKMADGWDTGDGAHGSVHRLGREQGESGHPVMASITTGWQPSCACDAPAVPCTVLDPFGGAGTTGLVADRLQRDAILIELSPAYAAMARARIVGDAPLLAEVAD